MSLLDHPEYLLKPFRLDELPPFYCPSCGRSLVLDPKRSISGEYGRSAVLWEVGAIAPQDRSGPFALFLRCTSTDCRSEVLMCGEESTECFPDYNSGRNRYENFYDPRFFIPTLSLFPVSKSTPDSVKTHLESSFSLFWNDPSAACNSIRKAIEALMDHSRIRRSKITPKRKMTRLSLHQRIEEWGAKSPEQLELSRLLLAIKWLGNSGSHMQRLEKRDSIEAYKLAEYVFSEVFDKRTQSLHKSARKLNIKKGPIK